MVGEENQKMEMRSLSESVGGVGTDANPVLQPNDRAVVAFVCAIGYRKLNTAYQALINGAPFCPIDKTCPMPGGGIR
jgi:hypothetical protein